MIGCDCAVCHSPDPRDNRTRSSIFLKTPECAFVVDTGADFRAQALRDGELVAFPTPAFQEIAAGAASVKPEPQVSTGEQSNTSVFFGDRFVLKLFRRLDPGINPDLE